MYLALQNTYQEIHLALFNTTHLIAQINADKTQASSSLVLLVDQLLHENNCTLDDLQFIGVNQGPGPFTTLRTIIAAVNGISFARKIPLVGVDGMKTFLQENFDQKTVTIGLFNAFNNDVYFGIHDTQSVTTGCKNIDIFLEKLKKTYNQNISFIGSGVAMHAEKIRAIFGPYAIIADDIPLAPSIKTIALTAFEKWSKNKEVITQLQPLYLKTQEFKKV